MEVFSNEKDCAADFNNRISPRRVSSVSENDESVEVRPVVVRWSDRKVG